MSTQPEALDLADWLDSVSDGISGRKAASELRRLHAENEALRILAKRWLAVRSGHIYIEHIDDEIYMADSDGGKYYADPRDMDMEIDESIAKAEGREA